MKDKNAKRLNFLKGSQSHNPSQTNGSTKIHIDSKTAIPKLKNLAVILSFGATGGFVQIEEETQLGDTPIVLMLKNRSLINEDELSMFVEFFYNKSHGSSEKFTI